VSIVTVANCQTYCRLSAGTDDALFTILLAGVEDWIERTFGIGLSEATHVEYLDGGMANLWTWHYPVVSVTQVYDEEDGAAEATTEYYLRGRWPIRRDGGGVWPSGGGELGRGRYKVTYVGGFGTTIAMPGMLKTIVLQLVARAYDNRPGLSAESSAGHTVNWQALADTDMVKQLSGIKPASFVG